MPVFCRQKIEISDIQKAPGELSPGAFLMYFLFYI